MHTTIAGLNVEVFQAREGTPRSAVILCHGFGAPGDDLVGLGEALVQSQPSLADVRFYFPAAPLELGQAGWGDARAWWLIDMAAVQRLQSDPEALKEFRKVEPDGMPAARKLLLALVKQVADSTGLAMSKVVVGGFSQGAMLATDVSLRLEESPAALCVLSGTLLIEDQWKAKIAARTSLKVFQSHGRQDPILPFQAATWLSELFTASGLQHEFVPFAGGHTIPPDVLGRLGTFLVRTLGP